MPSPPSFEQRTSVLFHITATQNEFKRPVTTSQLDCAAHVT
jgi:hypothetical protein